MNAEKKRTLRNLNLLEQGVRLDTVSIGTQGFKHYMIGCLVDWMLSKGIPANQLNSALKPIKKIMYDFQTIVDLDVRVYGCEENGQIIREAIFSEKLRADRFLPKTGEVIEIKDSDSEKSILRKKRAYTNMGLKTEVC